MQAPPVQRDELPGVMECINQEEHPQSIGTSSLSTHRQHGIMDDVSSRRTMESIMADRAERSNGSSHNDMHMQLMSNADPNATATTHAGNLRNKNGRGYTLLSRPEDPPAQDLLHRSSPGGPKTVPPRLPLRGRSVSTDSRLSSLLPISGGPLIPSPLPSPVTATVNSLTALSISQSGSATPWLSGRDPTRITVPRERRTRPGSISTAEFFQSESQAHKDPSGAGYQMELSEETSDPETPTLQRLAPKALTDPPSPAAVAVAAAAAAVGSQGQRTSPPTPTAPTPSMSGGLKSPTLKSASQLRVSLFNLVSTGYLPANTVAVFREHTAIVTGKGTLIPHYKESDALTRSPWLQSEYETPSAWATAMVKGARTGKVAVNGWSAIKIPFEQNSAVAKMFEGQGLSEVSLDALRKRYLTDLIDDNDTASSQMSTRGATAADRKKRKRLPVRSTDQTNGPRISTTQGNNNSITNVAQTDTKPHRPRKRTMSDLSGMVTSELYTDRQLQIEAAGALFSMQGPFNSLANSFPSRGIRGGKARPRLSRSNFKVPLESVARHRQAIEAIWSESGRIRPPALQTVTPLSLDRVVIRPSSGATADLSDYCVLCGASGESHNGDKAAGVDALAKCVDCGDGYHLGCLPSDGLCRPSLQGQAWRCPCCTTCLTCQKSTYEAPTLTLKKDGKPITATSNTANNASLSTENASDEDIQVLQCVKCESQTHFQCQLSLEPFLADVFGLKRSMVQDPLIWICVNCRECVECGRRQDSDGQPMEEDEDVGPTGNSTQDTKDDGSDQTTTSTTTTTLQHYEIWTSGFSLCPSCTYLADKGNVCPLCSKVYEDDDYETPMIFCDGCSLWVHVACDKGLQDRDYEELGQDSKKYFCPSCVPTPISSPTHSSSSSMLSTANSVEQSPRQDPYGYRPGLESCSSYEGIPFGRDDDYFSPQWRRKDDLLDLIRAAKVISEAESIPHSPYRSNGGGIIGGGGGISAAPVLHGARPRSVSVSLESVAEVAAAEALLTIFSGTSTPIASSP